MKIDGNTDSKVIMQLEGDVEDIWWVSRARYDAEEHRLYVEYDEFLVSPADLIRAVQQWGRFKVRGIS